MEGKIPCIETPIKIGGGTGSTKIPAIEEIERFYRATKRGHYTGFQRVTG